MSRDNKNKKERGFDEANSQDKELKRLRRQDLLELLVAQSEEIDRLRAQLAKTQDQLNEKTIAMREAGSLAEAAVKISGVMEAAQEAADIYLESLKQMAGTDDRLPR